MFWSYALIRRITDLTPNLTQPSAFPSTKTFRATRVPVTTPHLDCHRNQLTAVKTQRRELSCLRRVFGNFTLLVARLT